MNMAYGYSLGKKEWEIADERLDYKISSLVRQLSELSTRIEKLQQDIAELKQITASKKVIGPKRRKPAVKKKVL